MTTDAVFVVADRLDLFLEIEAIGEAIVVLEHRHGCTAEIESLRRRLHQVRVLVFGQLRALLDAGHTQPIVH